MGLSQLVNEQQHGVRVEAEVGSADSEEFARLAKGVNQYLSNCNVLLLDVVSKKAFVLNPIKQTARSVHQITHATAVKWQKSDALFRNTAAS